MMKRLKGIGNGAKTTPPLISRRPSSLLLRSAIQMGAAMPAGKSAADMKACQARHSSECRVPHRWPTCRGNTVSHGPSDHR